jgi:hypothetical protein
LASFTYYYSIDGGSSYQDGRSDQNPLIIQGLLLKSDPYLVSIKARSTGWESIPSNMVSGVPYIVGSPLVVSNVISINNGLTVNFTDTVDE